MPVVDSYPPGIFCWVELAAADADKAKRFYQELLDWEATDIPMGAAGTYTILSYGGKQVGALYQMRPEKRNEGGPAHWLSYVAVSNADAAAAKAEGLGAKLLSPAFDVGDAGRMAMIEDPTGAEFAVWQANKNHGAQLVNEPNSVCWNELQTTDLTKAEKFYDDLFGWKAKYGQGAAIDQYVEFQNGPRSAGGMLEIQEEWGDYPASWVVYFAVADLDASIAKAKELGGEEMMPPLEIEGVGRFSYLKDDDGAAFCLIQLAEGALD